MPIRRARTELLLLSLPEWRAQPIKDRQLCGADCFAPLSVSISGSVSRTDRCGAHMDRMDIVVPDSIIVVRDGVRNISVLSKLIHLLAFISATMAA